MALEYAESMPMSFPEVWVGVGRVDDVDFDRNLLPHPPSNVVCDIFLATGLESPFVPFDNVNLPSNFRSKFC